MSAAALNWAWETPAAAGDTTMRLVLLALADRADEDGFVTADQSVVARYAETTRSTVNRKLKELESGGWVELVHPKDTRDPVLYLLRVNGVSAAKVVSARLTSEERDQQKTALRLVDRYPVLGDLCRTDTDHVSPKGLDLVLDLDQTLKVEGQGLTGARAARPRNVAWDAVAEVCSAGAGQSAAIGQALKIIRTDWRNQHGPEPEPDELAAEIRRRAAHWQSHFEDATLTVTALAKHWMLLERRGARSRGLTTEEILSYDFGAPWPEEAS